MKIGNRITPEISDRIKLLSKQSISNKEIAKLCEVDIKAVYNHTRTDEQYRNAREMEKLRYMNRKIIRTNKFNEIAENGLGKVIEIALIASRQRVKTKKGRVIYTDNNKFVYETELGYTETVMKHDEQCGQVQILSVGIL